MQIEDATLAALFWAAAATGDEGDAMTLCEDERDEDEALYECDGHFDKEDI